MRNLVACVLTLTLAALASLMMAPAAMSQRMIDSVEVLVNDEPITTVDIEQRLRLVIAISGGVSSEEEFLKVREQVLQAMVDERLQLQEAAEFELEIPDDQLEQFFAQRAQSAGQTPEQFALALSSIQSSKDTMVRQMEAEFAWSELVQGRLGPQVNVADEEVNGYIQRIRDNRGKAEYRLGEIVLLVNNPGQRESVMASARELVARLRDGATFAEIAQQLSASPSAALGGELGWVTEDDLFPAQQTAISAMDTGQISDPITTPGGIQILALIDKRRVLTAEPLDDAIDLRQVWLPTELMADADRVAHFRSVIAEIQADQTADHCSILPEYATRAKADERVQIGTLRLRSLRSDARAMLNELPLNTPSPMLDENDGIRIFFVCGREKAQVSEPEFDQVLNQLEQQRLAMMGRRYLRDLRRKAIVDYR